MSNIVLIYVTLTSAFVHVPFGGASPRGVVVERQAFVAVRSCGIVFALTYPGDGTVARVGIDALGGVTVAFAAGAHGDVGYRVEIGA